MGPFFNRLQLYGLCPPLLPEAGLWLIWESREGLKISLCSAGFVSEGTNHQWQGGWASKQNSHVIPTLGLVPGP